MILSDLNQISCRYGGRTIFQKLNWTIQTGEKIGLVGPNGIGKSSLLRILAGSETPAEGEITRRRDMQIAYLEQEYTGVAERAVLDELIAADTVIGTIETRLNEIEHLLDNPQSSVDLDQLGALIDEQTTLIDQHQTLGGPILRGRAEALLRSLSFHEEIWHKPMHVLSGGQRKLVGLARCLLCEPDLLLLDEPDNHLDVERKTQLEQLVRDFRGAVVIISHDRYLLDETVNLIVELEPTTQGALLQRWEGNYSAYAAQKELALLKQQQDYIAQQKEIARLEEAIVRFKQWAHIVVNERHIKQARNKQRQIDRMELVERPVLERRRMALTFRPKLRGGTKAIELRGIGRSFGEQIVLIDNSATILNGERIGIIGPNGAGKSVLLQLISGRLALDEGEIWVGPSIQIGSYTQHHETLDPGQTPIETLRALRPMAIEEAMAQLSRFLIPFDAANAPIARLSGGEKSRVQLACLMLGGANCLLLDEPTNNLDIASAEQLEAALDAFAGTVLVVSHDRYLLDRVVDRIFALDQGELRTFPGSYSEYQAMAGRP
jgi:ATP-binding cassette subfamily F protein 3